MHCFTFYICIGVMCVCVHICVCVCVCVRTYVHVSASVWVGGVWVCTHVGERGKEDRSLHVSGVHYDLFRLFFLNVPLCTFSPIILRKTTSYNVMFYTYVFTN